MKFLEFNMPDWVMPALGLVVASSAVWWIVLARGLGWMSPDAAAALSAQHVQTAVVAYATPVCVARFERQPNAVAVWKKLRKDKEDWTWADFIRERSGFLAEHGQTLSPDLAEAIASSCATELLKLTSIDGVKLI